VAGSYDALLEHATEALLVIEQGQRFYQVVNPAAERLLGYSRAELLRLGPSDLAAPADAPRLAEIGTQVATQGWWHGEWTLRRKDGSVVHTEATVVQVVVDGRVLIQGLHRDRTDQWRTDALAHAHEVQHELNNQLALTTGYAELLAQDPRLPADLLDAAREALAGGLGAVEAGKRLIACFAAVRLSEFRRQREEERAAVADRAFSPHAAPMRLDDQPRDVQPQPETGDVAGPRATAREPLEQA
jgi:PAS domain S-box-containing protein